MTLTANLRASVWFRSASGYGHKYIESVVSPFEENMGCCCGPNHYHRHPSLFWAYPTGLKKATGKQPMALDTDTPHYNLHSFQNDLWVHPGLYETQF